VRSGGKQEEVAVRLLGEPDEEFMALLLVASGDGEVGGAVSFVDDDEIRCVLQEVGLAGVGLGEIDADHDEGVPAEDAVVAGGQLAFELADRAGADDDGGDAELVVKFLAPLIAEVRRAKDAEAGDFAAVEQLAGDEEGLNGLADADVVGDEHADGVEPQGHEQGDELVGPGPDADAAEGAEGAGSVAKSEPGRVEQKLDGDGIAGLARVGRREMGRGDGIEIEVMEAVVDTDDFVVGARERAKQVDVLVRRGKNNPFPVPAPDDRADGEGAHGQSCLLSSLGPKTSG
jgi:hypothetical protein